MKEENNIIKVSKDDIKLLLDDLTKNIDDYCGDYGTLESRLEETLRKILNLLKIMNGEEDNGELSILKIFKDR